MPDTLNMPDLINRYFSSNLWLIAFIASIVYLFFRVNTAGKRAILAAVVAFFLVINVFVIRFYTKLGENGTFYRHIWAIPITAVIGLAIVDLVRVLPKWFLKIPAIAAFAVFLWFANQEYIRCKEQIFSFDAKMVSQDVIELVDGLEGIRNRRGKNTLLVVCPVGYWIPYGNMQTELDTYGGFIDVYSPSILDNAEHNGEEELTSSNPDIRYIMETCCSKGMDYIVVPRIEDNIQYYREYGYEPVVETNNYAAYFCSGYPGITLDTNQYGLTAWVQYYDENGDPCLNNHGYSKEVYSYNHEGEKTREDYYDQYESLVLRSDTQYASKELIRNNRELVGERYYDVDGNPKICAFGYAGINRSYDSERRSLKQEYLDENEKITVVPAGYSIYEILFDGKNNVIEEDFLDKDGHLIIRNTGYASVKKEYDEDNRLIKETYYDDLGEHINSHGGYAGFERIYKDGSLVQEIKLDAANTEFSLQKLVNSGVQLEEVHIGIPNCARTYRFLWISDLHIAIENDEIAEENKELVRGRQQSWAIRADGKQAGDYWTEELAELIKDAHPDAVFLGGDMIDFCSEATVDKFKEGLEKINVPWIYIRADHDSEPYWLSNQDEKLSTSRQNSIGQNDELIILECEEFIILGINNSTSQLSEDALSKINEIVGKNKHIIVLTHVPYDSEVDRTLDEVSRTAWGDRNLTWGKGTSYAPDQITQEWMNIIYSENTPVKEILAGHLHLTWDGMVNERVHQHIFSQAYSQNIGLITVDGIITP